MSPRTAESNALANVMGVNNPVPFDQKECDAKIARVVKEAAERNAKNNAERDAKNGVNSPTAIENRNKLAWYELKQTCKNAAIRLNSYGMPDCRLAQERIDAALVARKVAAESGSLNEERRQERLLQGFEANLGRAQERLERFRKENTQAVVALQNFERSLVPAKSVNVPK